MIVEIQLIAVMTDEGLGLHLSSFGFIFLPAEVRLVRFSKCLQRIKRYAAEIKWNH